MSTARLRLRPLPGMLRPALAVVLPTRPEPTLLLDAGAIADPKPEMLVQFAQLGVAYAQTAYGISEPRVGLLTIGTEPGKGNKLARRAYELLDADPPHGGLPISFVGNVEGGDLLAGKVDVVVTDGFTGNVALKTLEGTAAFAARQLREALTGSRAARIGTLLQRRGLRELRRAHGHRDLRRGGAARAGGHGGHRARSGHGPRRRGRLRAGGEPGPRPDHGEDHRTARFATRRPSCAVPTPLRAVRRHERWASVCSAAATAAPTRLGT